MYKRLQLWERPFYVLKSIPYDSMNIILGNSEFSVYNLINFIVASISKSQIPLIKKQANVSTYQDSTVIKGESDCRCSRYMCEDI